MSAIRITNFSMRPAALSDIPSLLLLTELVFHDLVFPASEQQALIHQTRAILQSAIPEGRSYIAQIESDIIGFGGWTQDQTPVTIPVTAEQGVLYALVVHPHWRRRGVGRQLIKLCELTAQRQWVQELVIPVMPGTEGFPYALHYAFMQEADFVLTNGSMIQMRLFSKVLSHP